MDTQLARHTGVHSGGDIRLSLGAVQTQQVSHAITSAITSEQHTMQSAALYSCQLCCLLSFGDVAHHQPHRKVQYIA
jgi:hypothetical protein